MEHVNPAHLSPRHDHERTDVRVRIVLIFAGSLVVAALLTHLTIAWLFRYLEREHTAEIGPPVSIISPPRELPPPPRLQVQPQMDLQQLRAQEDSRLNDYGWVDRQNGIVRIPIERAMDLIAQQGLPAAAPTAKPPAQSTAPGGQNVPAPR
jgi:hypothetical protein